MDASSPAERTLRARYEGFRVLNLDLDLTRGKPSSEQLDLSNLMLGITSTRSRDGIDCRNYGHLEGLPEARKLFGEYMGPGARNTYVLGNSSLELMHDLMLHLLVRQAPGESRRWDTYHNLRHRPVMICPVPGYDRHHAICEQYGIEMVPVPLTEEGPDMDAVEAVLNGPKRWHVIGMWCTPKYSNPTGITYSREICERLASMEAYPGFRIFWDLAYNVHDLEEEGDILPDFLDLCRKARHEDRPLMIGSTSKITFAGAGLSILSASDANLAWCAEALKVKTIGPDKLNQLRHVRFLKDTAGIRAHMARHRAIIRPKFDAVDEILDRELSGSGIATWNKPRGGYFVSVYLSRGLAKKTVSLAADVGVKLTPAGAAYPYGVDPNDSHIRIAPTFPPLGQVRQAIEVFAVCTRLAAAS